MSESYDVPGCPSEVKKLGCYSGLYCEEPDVFEPENRQELENIFAYAREHGCKITFRGGQHSFDSQSLNDDIVVSMKRFDHIGELQEGEDGTSQIAVGPGATWGAIIRKLKPLGYLPAVTVTTEDATAGGTMSGDCLSRFSCAFGKEGTRIKRFELMTPEGTVLTCTPPGENVPWDAMTLEEKTFLGAIGGLGYLGAVLSITYHVEEVGPPGTRMAISTAATVRKSFDGLGKKLIPTTAKVVGQRPASFLDEDKTDALYALLIVDRKERRSALFFESNVTTQRSPGRFGAGRLLINRPKLLIRIPIEWALRIQRVCELALTMYGRSLGKQKKRTKRYVDDVEGFTFFMDGNARAHKWGRRFRFKMQVIQQTFVVPSEETPYEDSQRALVTWLRAMHNEFRGRGLRPTLWDVLWLPRDDGFLLSASTGMAGYAVSCAFETSNKEEHIRIKAAFRNLSRRLHEEYGGRVYLVKNVQAAPEILEQMYGQNADRFFELKLQLDPNWTLQNRFLEKNFPGYPKAPPTPPPPDTTVAAGRVSDTQPGRGAPAEEEEQPARRE